MPILMPHLKPVHTGDKSCRKRRQIVASNGNKYCRKRQQKSLFPAAFVAVSGDNLSPFRATFVAVFGDYSFSYNLSPFSATFVASVHRLLQYTHSCTAMHIRCNSTHIWEDALGQTPTPFWSVLGCHLCFFQVIPVLNKSSLTVLLHTNSTLHVQVNTWGHVNNKRIKAFLLISISTTDLSRRQPTTHNSTVSWLASKHYNYEVRPINM